ncbi:DUF1992 domain-containing protein [Amnibacterium flavum]|uniref:DUF1992 domain-containing protein n=1 Tax=Amnibacterium flavum TaxID=2173173 RepID=A0A2V1HQB8_9MICO|nr:DUF1992 domain-containing protein [Amnibacterium flavum]PVZ94728.1 DUF1992 domain-containing protein [Amnibacterium flavum]
MSDDARLRAARYQLDPSTAGNGAADGDEAPPAPNAEQRAAYVETAIQQAMRRGDFDNLPGKGKPLPELGATHDPDWWIRRKIQTERLTGLGPPALTLRTESAELQGRLDALHSEQDVRDVIADFNRRVREARRQLLGGPPVVTPLRDEDAELVGWRERRLARAEALDRERRAEAERLAGLTRRERRRLRRSGGIV